MPPWQVPIKLKLKINETLVLKSHKQYFFWALQQWDDNIIKLESQTGEPDSRVFTFRAKTRGPFHVHLEQSTAWNIRDYSVDFNLYILSGEVE